MVIIFGKDSCPYTMAARDDYDARGVAFEVREREEEPRAAVRDVEGTAAAGARSP